jgi:uncharacterized HAD superfamily protein
MEAICVDIDNVIAHTDEVMREVIRDCSKDKVELAYEDVVCFDYWKCRDSSGRRFDKGEWRTIHEEFTRTHLLRIRPVESVNESLHRIAKRFEIHLATSRLPAGREDTLAWLAKYEIPHCKLHFVEHGQKHRIDNRFAAAIDDDREQGYEFHASGTQVFLLAHPWNEVGSRSSLKRVADWGKLTEGVLDLTVA